MTLMVLFSPLQGVPDTGSHPNVGFKVLSFSVKTKYTRCQVAAGTFYNQPLARLYSLARWSTVAFLHGFQSRPQYMLPTDFLFSMHNCSYMDNSSIHQCRHSPVIFPNQQFSPSEKLLHTDSSQEPQGPYLPDIPQHKSRTRQHPGQGHTLSAPIGKHSAYMHRPRAQNVFLKVNQVF